MSSYTIVYIKEKARVSETLAFVYQFPDLTFCYSVQSFSNLMKHLHKVPGRSFGFKAKAVLTMEAFHVGETRRVSEDILRLLVRYRVSQRPSFGSRYIRHYHSHTTLPTTLTCHTTLLPTPLVPD